MDTETELLSLKAAEESIAILTALQNLKNGHETCICLHLSSALDRDSLAPRGALEKLRWIQSSANKTTFSKVGWEELWENLFGPSAREILASDIKTIMEELRVAKGTEMEALALGERGELD